MSIINIYSKLLVFSDADVGTADPQRRNVDWSTRLQGVAVRRATSKEYDVDPGATSTIFSGQRTLNVDGTTAFALTLNPYSPGVYRMTNTSGTLPGFRTSRSLAFATQVVTAAVNNNATITFSVPSLSASDFTAVMVGDTVFLPDTTTGDSASPFNGLNVGEWTVIGKAGDNLSVTCSRPTGVAFTGTDESATVATSTQLQAFSSGPVRVGDSLRLSAGFSPVSFGTYVITAMTSSWVEFVSTQSLPLEAGILPTATGIAIYSQAKRFLHVESDQQLKLLINGEPDSNWVVEPLAVGDKPGWVEGWVNIWRLDVVNRSPGSPAHVVIVSVE